MNKSLCLLTIVSLAICFAFFTKPIIAQEDLVPVRVTIERTFWGGCGDTIGPPDIYFNVYIDGVELTTRDNPQEINISPFDTNFDFVVEVNPSHTTVPIIIEQWDSDSLSDDDQCDISPQGKELNLNLNLGTCQISGDIPTTCGTSTSTGLYYSPATGDDAFVFSIDVNEPLRDRVRCLHNPIWPQPGDTVTITAEALTAGAIVRSGGIDNIEIWVGNTASPVASTATTPGSEGVSVFSFDYVIPSGADQMTYRCRVIDDGQISSTNWRQTQIGQPAAGRAVPILMNGDQNTSVDLVFISDADNYTGANDSQFLEDVYKVIHDAYYAGDYNYRRAGHAFLRRQDEINFWIALDSGDADGYDPSTLTCAFTAPNNWATDYTFANAGIVLHTDTFRDCATFGRRLLSSEPTELGTLLHETGHLPFGLADEYCCDGGYYQQNLVPNVYTSQADCQADALAVGVTGACLQITDPLTGDQPTDPSTGSPRDLFRLDSDEDTYFNDLMTGQGINAPGAQSHIPRNADGRRINWYFENCRDDGC